MARTTGRSARQAGHRFERNVALAIAAYVHGFAGPLTSTECPVQTTRNVVKSSKGDIAQQREDGLWVPYVWRPGGKFPQGQTWSLECKSTAAWTVPKWMEQALLNREVDGSDCTAVIVDRPNKPVGTSWVITPDYRGGPWPYTFRTLDQWMEVDL